MAVSPNALLQTWPYDLFGKPLRDPSVGVIDPLIRTPMDQGFKTRQRFLSAMLTGTYSVLMTNAVYALFLSWHKHKIADGNDWFNFQVRVGNSFSWEEVKMTNNFMAQPDHNKYVRVSFSLVQRTDSIPSEDTLDAALS